ncbi:hypothetical protein K502DRAFT_348948 [Neoconidiobolus thromboides FSU 785]|nr:hypothetical protein K502DRAFT_348948 [Neoconidiobolus thromboides FSU 785]
MSYNLSNIDPEDKNKEFIDLSRSLMNELDSSSEELHSDDNGSSNEITNNHSNGISSTSLQYNADTRLYRTPSHKTVNLNSITDNDIHGLNHQNLMGGMAFNLGNSLL